MEGVEPVAPEDLRVGMFVLAVDVLSRTSIVGQITQIVTEANGYRTVSIRSVDDEPSRTFVAAPEGHPQLTAFFISAHRGREDEEPSPPAREEEASEDVLSEHEPTPRSFESPPASPRRGGPSNPASANPTPQRPGRRGGKKTKRRGPKRGRRNGTRK